MTRTLALPVLLLRIMMEARASRAFRVKDALTQVVEKTRSSTSNKRIVGETLSCFL